MNNKYPFLLLCMYEINGPKTIKEHIESLKELSDYPIEVYNIHDEVDQLMLFRCFDLNNYAGVIIHNTLSYSISNVEKLDKRFVIKLKDYHGLKIIFKQDEMRNVNELKNYLRRNKFDLLFSCVPEESIGKVYGDIDIKVVNMLTGYVTSEMRSYKYSQLDAREIDIFYRGMKLPYFFGELSYEKLLIGEKFKQVCQKNKLICDVSSEMKDRIYGEKWINKLSNTKAVLGVESGGSVFDFDNTLEKNYNNILQENPNITFYQYQEKYLNGIDGQIQYNQISPRHFEAASTKTLQILFEGTYSGIFKPYKHYISLKKDFSNIDEVLSLLGNKQFRIDVTNRAYNEIIMNNNYSYDAFVKLFDNNIKTIDKKNLASKKYFQFLEYLLLISITSKGLALKLARRAYHFLKRWK